jgi:cytochrome c-type biogenesis protein CcmH/NrfF
MNTASLWALLAPMALLLLIGAGVLIKRVLARRRRRKGRPVLLWHR